MTKWLRCLIGSFAAGALLSAFVQARAETFSLDMKRFETPGRSGAMDPASAMARNVSSQGFFMQIQAGAAAEPQRELFDKLVKKEPKYETEHPFRGVASLGTQQFVFSLDSVALKEPEKEETKKEKAKDKSSEEAEDDAEEDLNLPKFVSYNRLYFDRNHNGDLTDDGVVVAIKQPTRGYFGRAPAQASFPRVDLTIEIDGAKLDYSFLFSIYSYGRSDYSYASASLRAAAYRTGEITLGGKKKKIILVDYNSNGRYDDRFSVVENARTPNGRVHPQMGDVLLVDPAAGSPRGSSTASDSRIQVSKLVRLDDRYFNLKVSPTGDKLTLDSSTVPLGFVTNPSPSFDAVVYSDLGMLRIASKEPSEPVAIPAGKWKLVSYNIDGTKHEKEEPKKEEPKKEETKGSTSLLSMLSKALLGSTSGKARPNPLYPKFTRVSAHATQDAPAIEVREGKTTTMPFGPPYRPVVKSSYRKATGQASLSLSIVGSAGEVCTDLRVEGSRPASPKFTITTTDGEEVDVGKFKYG